MVLDDVLDDEAVNDADNPITVSRGMMLLFGKHTFIVVHVTHEVLQRAARRTAE